MNKEEIKILEYQQIATILFIGSLLISFFLTCADKVELTSNKKILSDSNYYKLSVFYRSLVVILSLVFFYTNYREKVITQEQGEDITPNNLQIAASELSILAALIVLYVVVTSGNYSVITTTGNPNL